MDLKKLVVWTKDARKPDRLKEMVRKEADLVVCNNLLAEIGNRATMSMAAQTLANKYSVDVAEYIDTLIKRGVKVPDEFMAPKPAGGQADGRR
jgi:hypothetical protein